MEVEFKMCTLWKEQTKIVKKAIYEKFIFSKNFKVILLNNLFFNQSLENKNKTVENKNPV